MRIVRVILKKLAREGKEKTERRRIDSVWNCWHRAKTKRALLNWERQLQEERARGRRQERKQVEQEATENMAERKAVIKNADMSEDMQQDSIDCATQVFHHYL